MIGELAALLSAVSWTFSSVAYRKALSFANPFQGNLIRFASTSVGLIVFLAALGRISALVHLPFSLALIAILSGIIGLVFGDTLYMFALRSLGVARAVPIAFIYPLFNISIAILLKGEAITIPVALGAVSVVVGIWLTSCKSSEMNNRCTTSLDKGVMAALGAAVFWSVGITLLNVAVSSSEVTSLDDLLALITVRVLAALIVFLAVSPVFDRDFGFLKMPWRTWLIMAAGGLVALGLGGFLLCYSFLYTQEVRAVPISSTTPFFSVIAGIVFFHEPVGLRIILGSIAIGVGISLLFV